jgi:hypothetical protein
MKPSRQTGANFKREGSPGPVGAPLCDRTAAATGVLVECVLPPKALHLRNVCRIMNTLYCSERLYQAAVT